MAARKKLDVKLLQELLGGSAEAPGVFQGLLGFRTGTTKLKAVHVMNDLAQTILRQAPAHRGDLICRVVRERRGDDEDNSDGALRADPKIGRAYSRAYPERLGAQAISELRRAADVVLNFDDGVFKAGTRMASPLATHVGLLGDEGFRRFLVGPFIASLLGEQGRARVEALFRSDMDPVSRAMRPLFRGVALEERPPGDPERAPSGLDRSLRDGLSRLLTHRLSKPTILRNLALASSLAVLLKVYGAGRPEGRPTLLALPALGDGPGPLRKQSVQALLRGRDALDRAIRDQLALHPRFEELWSTRPRPEDPFIEVPGGRRDPEVILEAVREMRRHRRERGSSEVELYWPDSFALALGQREGFVLPKDRRAGWLPYLALSPEHVELLVLMQIGAEEDALPWRELWATIRSSLGLVIGAAPSVDATALGDAGVPHVSLDDLARNARRLLDASVRRGVAQRLPDSGAIAKGGWV